MSLACVGRTCSVPTTRFAPARGACFPRLRCSGSRLLSRERALHGVWFQCSGSPQTRGLGWACVLCLPRRAAQAARSLPGALSPGAVRLLPSVAPASVSGRTSEVRLVSVLGSWSLARDPPGRCQPSRISGGLWLETGSLFAVWWGCRLWGRVGPFPLPAASCLRRGLGRSASSWLFSGIAQFFLCSVKGPAGCSGLLIFSLSLAVPQFKLVTHKSSLRSPSGHSGPVLTLSNAAGSSLFCPHLLVADAGVWGTFLLGVAFRHVICGFYFIFPPS